MTRRSQLIVLVAVLLLALTITSFAITPMPSIPVSSMFDWTSLFNKTHPRSLIETGITGNVSIANIAPLCTNTGTLPDPSDNTTVVVTSQSAPQTSVPVNWRIIDGCELFGTFQSSLDPGTYSLTLSYCLGNPTGQYQPAGCPHAACGLQSCNLPMTVVVQLGKLTPVRIGITTGIY